MSRQNLIVGVPIAVSLALGPIAGPTRAGHSLEVERSQPTVSFDIDEHLMALEEMTNRKGDAALRKFLEEHIAPKYRESEGEAALLEVLALVRERCGNAGGVGINPLSGDHFRIKFETGAGAWNVDLVFGQDPDSLIESLALSSAEAPKKLAPLEWDNFEERLLEYEREGFCGSLLLARNGVVVHSRGYGLASKKPHALNGEDTLFAIGSTPIDFTKAAILLLEDRGKLTTSDLVSKYLDGIPEDKASTTIHHLMEGQSGLRNFHGIRGVDEDLDLTYIDRKEALRRIFATELLFEPGTQRAHSHSAWAVLAAVVEQASGQDYGAFLAEHIFTPLAMERTGLYPHSLGFPDTEVAVGGSHRPLGGPSTPKSWGETSWLVMGSGGMVSTTCDLYRLMKGIRDGKLLSEASQRKYWAGGLLVGGNDRGFMTAYTEGPGTQFVLCSNSHDRSGDLVSKITRALGEMVRGTEVLPFAVGIGANISPRGVEVSTVVPSSAAQEAGLREGDIVVEANGMPAKQSFEGHLEEAARTGKVLTLKIDRGGKRQTISVIPRRRG